MWKPWHGKSGVAKAIAVSATVLLISLGLCGANAFAVLQWGSFDPAPGVPRRWVDTLLGVTAWTELIAIGISLAALVILWIVRAAAPTSRSAPDKEQD